jgi:Cys-tRNA(Pro) deacylase
MADEPRAVALLTEAGIAHEVVRTRRAANIEEAAELRGVSVRALLKTLVVRRQSNDYVLVLVPGDRVIDWAKLRAHLGERRLSLPDAAEAFAATGYERGTITPFGSTTAWPVVADASIAGLETVSLGAGAHGVSVTLRAETLIDVVEAQVADVTRLA